MSERTARSAHPRCFRFGSSLIFRLICFPADGRVVAEDGDVLFPIIKDSGHNMNGRTALMIKQMNLRERTLRSWYLTSSGKRGSRSKFFALLDSCTPERFTRVVQADLARSAPGGLRTLASIREYSRRNSPSTEDLRTAVPDEQALQWLFLHRGYLQYKHERVIERELPVSQAGIAREGWVDVLAFDTTVHQPILVELKQRSANDSLTGVLLEVLAHWAFHIRYLAEFRRQLIEGEILAAEDMAEPAVVIAAPESYFGETLRRSRHPRRHNDVRTASALIKCMRDHWNLQVRLLAISDDWQVVGAGFGVEEWSIPTSTI